LASACTWRGRNRDAASPMRGRHSRHSSTRRPSQPRRFPCTSQRTSP
jgi:hypothetical protein